MLEGPEKVDQWLEGENAFPAKEYSAAELKLPNNYLLE